MALNQTKNGLSPLAALRDEGLRRRLELLVHRLHPLLGERAGVLDPLAAVRERPGVQHAARRVLGAEGGVLRVVGVLRLFLGVQVVERAEEFVEAVHGGEHGVEVAEVVLAELAGHVALRLQELREGRVLRLQPFLGARQAHLEQAGAERALPGQEGAAAGGAALLAVEVGEDRAFVRDPVDVGRLVAHLAEVVGADIPVARCRRPR